jgi:dihydrofolate reductase
MALPIADKIYLTKVNTSPKGDTYFPVINAMEWWEINRQEFPADDQNEFSYQFIDLVRGSI